jgi:hypothetical protein
MWMLLQQWRMDIAIRQSPKGLGVSGLYEQSWDINQEGSIAEWLFLAASASRSKAGLVF